MNIVERSRRARRGYAVYAVIFTTLAAYSVVWQGHSWVGRAWVAWLTILSMYYAYQWRRLTDALNHPLIYLVALRDEFGEGS